MVGKMRGGPAKAAILGSGMTGLISGSSIAIQLLLELLQFQ